MTIFVLKAQFGKLPPRIINYKDFSSYQNAGFKYSLNEGLLEEEYMESLLKDSNCFSEVWTEILNDYAPCKKN